VEFKVFEGLPMFHPPCATRFSLSCPIHPVFLEAMEAFYPHAAGYGLDPFLGAYPAGSLQKENLSEKPENTFLKKRKGEISPL